MRWLPKTIFAIVAAFYAYGALVHIMNMSGMRGFDWLAAPFKWQMLDVVYLVLDTIVVMGLVQGWLISRVAFFTAAFSQILLYTVFREWIFDVPAEYALSADQQTYVSGLVFFHIVSAFLVFVMLIRLRRFREMDELSKTGM